MKKIKTIILISVLLVVYMQQSVSQQYMLIYHDNGSILEFEISEIRKLTFDQMVSFTETPVLQKLLSMNLFPNPASNYINIDFSVPEEGEVVLELFSLNGVLVKSIYPGKLPSGNHSYRWQTSDLVHGTYICMVRQNQQVLSRKVIVSN
jgi:hypothetical protein